MQHRFAWLLAVLPAIALADVPSDYIGHQYTGHAPVLGMQAVNSAIVLSPPQTAAHAVAFAVPAAAMPRGTPSLLWLVRDVAPDGARPVWQIRDAVQVDPLPAGAVWEDMGLCHGHSGPVLALVRPRPGRITPLAAWTADSDTERLRPVAIGQVRCTVPANS